MSNNGSGSLQINRGRNWLLFMQRCMMIDHMAHKKVPNENIHLHQLTPAPEAVCADLECQLQGE